MSVVKGLRPSTNAQKVTTLAISLTPEDAGVYLLGAVKIRIWSQSAMTVTVRGRAVWSSPIDTTFAVDSLTVPVGWSTHDVVLVDVAVSLSLTPVGGNATDTWDAVGYVPNEPVEICVSTC